MSPDSPHFACLGRLGHYGAGKRLDAWNRDRRLDNPLHRVRSRPPQVSTLRETRVSDSAGETNRQMLLNLGLLVLGQEGVTEFP